MVRIYEMVTFHYSYYIVTKFEMSFMSFSLYVFKYAVQNRFSFILLPKNIKILTPQHGPRRKHILPVYWCVLGICCGHYLETAIV
jgi:hypothetical protein